MGQIHLLGRPLPARARQSCRRHGRRSAFGDRDRTAVSPKAAFLYHASEHVSLRAGYYQALRTPTRNELVRFRIWSATALRDIVGRR